MVTQSRVVIYNPTTERHEPLAAGDTLDASILPPSAGSSRKLWIGKADYKVTTLPVCDNVWLVASAISSIGRKQGFTTYPTGASCTMPLIRTTGRM